jgi:hypothetical protein
LDVDVEGPAAGPRQAEHGVPDRHVALCQELERERKGEITETPIFVPATACESFMWMAYRT